MTLAGLAPLAKLFLADPQADWPYDVAVFGFFGGAAFLTSFSLRHAQENRCALEASPYKVWSEKMAVLAFAILCASLIVCLAQAAFGVLVWREFNAGRIAEPVMLLIIIICSTAFWTLVARSILGGLILTGAAQFVLYLLLVAFVRAIDAMAPGNPYATRVSHAPEVHAALLPFVAGFGLSYAALMFWLGGKKFTRIQRMNATVCDMVS